MFNNNHESKTRFAYTKYVFFEVTVYVFPLVQPGAASGSSGGGAGGGAKSEGGGTGKPGESEDKNDDDDGN
jgi:hypothetical protein